ncbi:MAG: glycosyltransferase family 2 protein [Lachnospiraceae bacterium]|nr:glycosyltransferase family 2 protein [Lachnospiraceae bacterium]
MSSALIVLNYNDPKTTCDFLDAASKLSSIDAVVVVDNRSSDDSYEILKKYESDRVSVVLSDRNGGYAYGNNIGCRTAIDRYGADVLFISNPDVRFTDDTVNAMQQALADDDSIGAVAPIVNQGYNIWNLPGVWGVIESVFLIWFNIDKRRIKNRLIASSNEVETVGAAEGSFWATTRAAYEKAGGLDERTFLYYEENIYAKRLKACGYKVAALTKKRYDHFHSVSIRKRFGGKTRAFAHFKPGMKLYLKEYTTCNAAGMMLFEIAFALGYVERVLFDIANEFLHVIHKN